MRILFHICTDFIHGNLKKKQKQDVCSKVLTPSLYPPAQPLKKKKKKEWGRMKWVVFISSKIPVRGYLSKHDGRTAAQWTLKDYDKTLRAREFIFAVSLTLLSLPSPPLSPCSPSAQTPAETHARGTGQPRDHAT